MNMPKHEPRAPHVCHKSHGAKSHLSPIGIAQTVWIIQNHTIRQNHYKGRDPTKDPTKDCAKGLCKTRHSRMIHCNLESSHNFNIISEPNVLIWLR